VIRHKIAEMARAVESTHALLEQVAYQMKCKVPDQQLGSLVALTKVQCTTTMELCAREASQVLGGAACIRGGKGDKVERIYREVSPDTTKPLLFFSSSCAPLSPVCSQVRMHAIAGGSEEILRDLAVKGVRAPPAPAKAAIKAKL
jgi:alkylation response protein AidB-like acyl-CoA dehydrogenase